MAEFFKKIRWENFKSYLTRKNLIIGLATLVILASGAWAASKFLGANEEKEGEAEGVREVELASIAALSSDKGDIPVSGEVRSSSEVVIRAEAQGIVKAIYKKVGDRLVAGETIAILENSSQYSDLIRAQAALESAQASYNKMRSGAREEQRSISSLGVNKEASNLGESAVSLISTMKSTHSTADDVLQNRLSLFFDLNTTFPVFTLNIFDQEEKIYFGIKKKELDERVISWRESLNKLSANASSETLAASAETSRKNLEEIKAYLDRMAIHVNDLTASGGLSQTTVDRYRSDISSSRSLVTGAISTLNASLVAYNNQKAAYQATVYQNQIVEKGERPEDLATAAAMVKQAQAGLLAAQTGYNKTIIKTPITGTLNDMDLKIGDYVSPLQTVAFVSNNNQLEVVTYVTETEAKDLSIGNNVKLGEAEGVVTSISPALDPVTKKIEIKVAVTKNQDKVTNGQSISLSIGRINQEATSTLPIPSELMIPLTALKIEPDRNVVFAVSANGTLEAKPVTQGPIVGSKIIIEGIDPFLKIVVDARGLKEGDKVKIKGS